MMTETPLKSWTITGPDEDGAPETITVTLAENPRWAADPDEEYRYHVRSYRGADPEDEVDFLGHDTREGAEACALVWREEIAAEYREREAGWRSDLAEAVEGAADDTPLAEDSAECVLADVAAVAIRQGQAKLYLEALRDAGLIV
jgi:hypothetical protein